jgi:hypothetical protein
MLSGSLEGQRFSAPCNHLVVYETDLGGRSVFLRMKESFEDCFPLELLVIEDPAPSSELSSVRSERSVNSRSAGVDMADENDGDDSGVLRIKWESVTVGPGRDASVAPSCIHFVCPPPPPALDLFEAMRIEELVLEGFKSYPVRTSITGWDVSFNAITGLNGSGKSNILDAICFVLGITNMSQASETVSASLFTS